MSVTFVRDATGAYVPSDWSAEPHEARVVGIFLAQAPKNPVTFKAAWASPHFRLGFVPNVAKEEWAVCVAHLTAHFRNRPDSRIGWFDAKGDLLSIIRVDPTKPNAVLGTALIPFRDLHVQFASGCPMVIEPAADPVRIVFDNPKRGQGGEVTAWLRSGPDSRVVPSIDGDVAVTLEGSDRGALQFHALVLNEEHAPLKLGIRYFVPDEAAPDGIVPTYVRVFRSPDLGKFIGFAALMHPCDPLPARTRWKFDAETIRLILPTDAGQPVDVRPVDASLILQSEPYAFGRRGGQRTTRDVYYLAPVGLFELLRSDGQAAKRCLAGGRLHLGWTGTETLVAKLGTDSDPGDLLEFVPDQPAFIPDGSAQLTDVGRTSWVLARPSKEKSEYSTGPEDARLHGAITCDATYEPASCSEPLGTALWHARLQAGVIDPGQSTRMFPLLPPASVEVDAPPGTSPAEALALKRRRLGAALALERRAVGPRRRSSLATQQAKAAVAEAVTPHGLLASFRSGLLDTVTLAMTPAVNGGDRSRLAFDGLATNTILARAFERERLFLVATTRDALSGLPSHLINVHDWQFKVLEGTSPQTTSRALILKFNDRPLRELLADVGAWYQADHFARGNASGVSDALLEHFSAPDDELPKSFIEALDDPTWTGVLATDVPLTASELPPEIRCLAPGIDMKRFRVHHVGIPSNRPCVKRGDIDVEDASVFAMIDYSAKVAFDKCVNDYLVESLRVEFDNSEIKRFECKVILHVAELLRRKLGPFDIRLDGHYESHRGKPAYSFLAPEANSIWPPNTVKTVMEKVDLGRIELVTEDPDEKNIVSRFGMDGRLTLRNYKDAWADLFSFEPLRFADLALRFTGNARDPKWDASQIRFDEPHSTKREKSLSFDFPLKLAGFVSRKPEEKSAFSLGDLGFHPVTLDGATMATGGSLHHGFVFDLDGGSLGSLVTSTSNLPFAVLLAWRVPDDGTDDVLAVGLRFPPSSNGRKELAVEGALKLSVGDLHLAKRASGAPAFELTMANPKLTVLGLDLNHEAPNPVRLIAGETPYERSGVQWTLKRQDGYDDLLDGLVKFRYAMAQHVVGLEEVTDFTSFTKLIASIEAVQNPAKYARERGWAIAADFKVLEKIELGVAFFDPTYFILQLKLKTFITEIRYRRVTDDIGVWEIEIDPNAAGLGSSLAIGGGLLRLPRISLHIYTNGDFLIDVGFPWNLNWARSGQFQAFPWIGWAGFYLGKLSGPTNGELQVCGKPHCGTCPKTFAVVRFGYAARIGLGFSFREGIFRFEAHISVFGTFEGAAAYPDQLVGAELLKPARYLLRGQFGGIAEFHAVVDFGIAKAAVHVEARIVASMTFQCDCAAQGISPLHVHADFDASVEVTVGEVCFLKNCVSLKVTYSFHTSYSRDIDVGKADCDLGKGLALAASVAPSLPWVAPLQRLESVVDVDPPLVAWFMAEPTRGEKGPQLVASLVMERSTLVRLIEKIGEWVKKNWECAATKTECKLPDPHSAVTIADVAKFIETTFGCIAITNPPDSGDPRPGVPFPMPPDLVLQIDRGDGKKVTVDFSKHNPCSDAYRKAIRKYFRQSWMVAPFEEPGGRADDGREKSLATIVFQDYFDCLVEAAHGQICKKTWDPKAIAEAASRVFRSGLRPPVEEKVGALDFLGDGGGAATTEALYVLTGQQHACTVDGTYRPVQVKLAVANGAKWLSLGKGDCKPEPELDQTLGDGLMADLDKVKLPTIPAGETKQLPGVLVEPFRAACPVSSAWRKDHRLWSFPERLFDEILACDREKSPLLVVFDRVKAKSDDKEILVGGALVTVVELRLKVVVPNGSQGATLAIEHVNERGKERLREVLNREGVSVARAHLVRFVEGSATKEIEDMADPPSIVAFRTSVSTETNPSLVAARAARVDTATCGPCRVRATLDEKREFARLVLDAGLTNSGGYFVQVPKDVVDKAEGTVIECSLVLEFETHDASAKFDLKPWHSGIRIVADGTLDATRYVEAVATINKETGKLSRIEAKQALPPGHVGFQLCVAVPTNGATADELIKREYHLLGYRLKGDDHFVTGPEATPASPASTACRTSEGEPGRLYRHVVPLEKAQPKVGVRSRFGSIGKDVAVLARWQDTFGNAGPQTDAKVHHGYSDRWLPVSEWPFESSRYEVTKVGPNLRFTVTLAFDAKNWCEARITAEADASWQRIALDVSRLELVRDQLGGPAASAVLRTSLGGESIDVTAALREHLDAIIGFMNAAAKPCPPKCPVMDPKPIERKLELDVKPPSVAAKLYAALTVSLNLERVFKEANFDPAAWSGLDSKDEKYAYEPIRRVECLIEPSHSNDASLVALAKTIESACAVKVAVSYQGARLAAGPATDSGRLWLVDATALDVAAVDWMPLAMRPLDVQLWSGSEKVKLPPCDGDKWTTIEAVDVDLDREARALHDAVEDILSPRLAAAYQAAAPDAFSCLVDAKARIARRLPGLLAPVLEGQSPTKEQLERADETLRNSLAGSLRGAYDIDCILSAKPKVTSPPSADRSYGLLLEATKVESKLGRLSRVRIPVTKGVVGSPCLLIDAPADVGSACPELHCAFSITHVEVDLERSGSDCDPSFSRWLRLVLPKPSAEIKLDVPLVLRCFPPVPLLRSHVGEPQDLASKGTACPSLELKKAALWDYKYTVAVDCEAQDVKVAGLHVVGDPAHRIEGNLEKLGSALLAFRTEYALLRGQLLHGSDTACFDRFVELVRAYASALEIDSDPAHADAAVTPPDEERGFECEPPGSGCTVVVPPWTGSHLEECKDPDGKVVPNCYAGTGLNVLADHPRARGSIQVRRNAFQMKTGPKVAAAFQLSSPRVSFGEWLTPFIDRRDTIWIDRDDHGAPANRTLGKHLEHAFGILFEKPGHDFQVNVESRYEFSARRASGDRAAANDCTDATLFTPIGLLTNVFVPKYENGTPAPSASLVKVVECQLAHWMKDAWPADHGRFVLDLAVFRRLACGLGNPDEGLAAAATLRLRRLVLSLDQIDK